MKLSRPPIIVAVSLLALSGCSAPSESNEEYPSETVKIIVPFAPGGSLDSNSRILAECLKESGGNWIIENREGGGGTIGVNALVSAEPDGHTLAYLSSSGMALTPLISDGSQYDKDDLVPLTIVTKAPAAILVRADSPYETAEDFFAAATSGSELSIATTGALGLYQLVVEQLANEAAIVPVPFDGTAPAVTAALGGNTEAVFAEVSGSTLESLNAGNMRALATGSTEPVAFLPDVPTLASLGYDLPESTNYGVIVGTSELPEDLQSEIAARFTECATDDSVAETIGTDFVLDPPMVGDEAQDLIDTATEQYQAALDARG
jgi:tripartite-type tricarboxylate transporter receptor subunit TctC